MKRKMLQGQALMLWLGAKVIALSKSCSINIAVELGDGNTKDDGLWDSGDIIGASFSLENQSVASADETVGIDLVYKELYNMMLAENPITASWGVPSNLNANGLPNEGWQLPTSGYYKGKVRITSLNWDGTKGSQSTIQVSLQGVGPIEPVEGGSGSGN